MALRYIFAIERGTYPLGIAVQKIGQGSYIQKTPEDLYTVPRFYKVPCCIRPRYLKYIKIYLLRYVKKYVKIRSLCSKILYRKGYGNCGGLMMS